MISETHLALLVLYFDPHIATRRAATKAESDASPGAIMDKLRTLKNNFNSPNVRIHCTLCTFFENIEGHTVR
jgi:hypothetical protein